MVSYSQIFQNNRQWIAEKTAMQSKDLGILNPWLRNIRDVGFKVTPPPPSEVSP